MGITILEDDSVTDFACGNLSRSPSAEKHVRMVLVMRGSERSRKDEHVIGVSDHLFEDMMATYHPLRDAGEAAGLSSNTLWAFRQLQQ